MFRAILYSTFTIASANNPLGEAVDLLVSLQGKIIAEGGAEAKAYDEYMAWCHDTEMNRGFDIKTSTSEKASLEATIAKATSDEGAASAAIEELAGAIAGGEADLKSATAVRAKEATDFAASEAELLDTRSALERAIAIIDREMAKNPAAFAQVDVSSFQNLAKSLSTILDAASIASSDQRRLVALAQTNTDDEDTELGAPAAAVYKTHSTSISEVLAGLREKCESQLADLRKAEQAALHAFEMTKQSLQDQAAADNKDLSEQKSAKAGAAKTVASATADLAVATKALADAKSALETATNTCAQVTADHEASVKGRKEELDAIASAVAVLKETSAGAVSQSYSFIQVSAGSTSRAQLASMEIVNVVKRLARQYHSTALSQLASKVDAVLKYGAASGVDPFAKVKGLITAMIARLESEASADATEKAYCDDEIAKTTAKKAELEAAAAKLTAGIDGAAAASAKLKDQVKDLQAELAALAKSQASMDAIRAEEHAAYVQAKADLELGLKGVRKAIETLRDYYGGASLVQQPATPTYHAAATGAGNSIIGILEVVESDFAKNLATAETGEADAAADYAKVTQANRITKTEKDQGVKYKTKEATGLDKKVSELSSDRSNTNAELDAVLEYYGQIKDRCIAKPETYADRSARRMSEIEGLKEALSILENEAAFLQQRKRGLSQVFLGSRA